MTYFYNLVHGTRRWTKPSPIFDTPQPKDYKIADLDFAEQCQIIKVKQAEYDTFLEQFDSRLSVWEVPLEQTSIEYPDWGEGKATVSATVEDSGTCVIITVVGTETSQPYKEMIAVLPHARRGMFSPDALERQVAVLDNGPARLMATQMAKAFFECKQGSMAATVVLNNFGRDDWDPWDAMKALELKIVRTVLRLATERDRLCQADKAVQPAA